MSDNEQEPGAPTPEQLRDLGVNPIIEAANGMSVQDVADGAATLLVMIASSQEDPTGFVNATCSAIREGVWAERRRRARSPLAEG